MVGNKASKEYLEFYQYILACFSEADSNKDGKIEFEEFEAIIAVSDRVFSSRSYAPYRVCHKIWTPFLAFFLFFAWFRL